MTTKHQSPEWRRTTRNVRARARRAHANGDTVVCWRCGQPLPVDAEDRLIFDVGHITTMGGEGIDNAAPEHRSKTGQCVGNRAHGGKLGARITNARKTSTSSFVPIPWA